MDRNLFYGDDLTFTDGSLSARRAWIEIYLSVFYAFSNMSLSARRAWIEIPAGCWRESRRARRSPQGERG